MATQFTCFIAAILFLVPYGLSAQGIEATVVREVGALDGPPCRTFGRVGGGALDSEGRLLVLDELNRTVQVLSSLNECEGSIGRAGRGPGEFGEPRRIRINDDTIYVLDIANLRIERFLLGSAPFRRLASISLRVVPEDFCTLGGSIFVLANHQGRSIHEIDASGSPVRSFGDITNERYPQLSSVEAKGHLACDASRRTIVHALAERPEIRAFDMSGAERWTAQIPGYRAMAITPSARGGVRFAPPEEGGQADLTVGITSVGAGTALVQIGAVAGLRIFQSIRSFTVDLDDGSLRRVRTLPAILSARQNMLVAAETVDYPKVILLQYRLQ